MFKDLKLRGRIFLGFSIPVFLIVVFSGLVYSVMSQISEKFNEVSRAQRVLAYTDEMVLSTAMMARQVRGYLLIPDEDTILEFRNQKLRYEESARIVESLLKDPEQKEIYRAMILAGQDYYQMSLRTLELKNENRHDEAVNLYLRESKTLVGRLDNLGETFNDNEQRILDDYTDQAQETIRFLIGAAIVTTLLSLVLGTVAASLIWSTIAQTNRTINETVNAIVSSSSEISATVEQQERSASYQASSANQTTSTMHQLGVSSSQTVEQAESAAENARQILGLAESSVVGARDVLSLAESSAQGSRQVLTLAEGGNKTVGRTLEGMSILKEKVGAIAQEILRLSEQTNQIGSITNLVSDLANQTNMLSLNAAVEAVRAGEHGKGFGVVAAEIRKLADQSKKSAEKINQLVFAIQSAINSTVMVTDEGRKTAETGIELSRDTADAFIKVTEAIEEIVLKSSEGVVQAINEVVLQNQQNSLAAVNEVVVNNQQISLTAKQQAVAIQEVVEAMNNLNQGAVQTASGITQTKVGIQKLNEAAHSLKTIV